MEALAMKPLLKTEWPVWKVNISICSFTYVTTWRSRAVRRAAAKTSAASFEYSFFLGLASTGKHTAASSETTSTRLSISVRPQARTKQLLCQPQSKVKPMCSQLVLDTAAPRDLDGWLISAIHTG